MVDRCENLESDWSTFALALTVILILGLIVFVIWNTDRIESGTKDGVKAELAQPVQAIPGR